MRPSPRYCLVLTCLMLLTSVVSGVSPVHADTPSPDFSTLEKLVQQYFLHARTRSTPILLTQSKVHDLLEELRGMRIYIPGRGQIVRSFPHDKEFFARFVLSELSQEPARSYPEDPTFLLQRIDAMCSSYDTIRHLNRIAGRGEAFSEDWMGTDAMFPQIEDAALEDILDDLGVRSAADAKPRRRNYTIDHLLEVLKTAYEPATPPATKTVSLDALGR
ncbi:hypothetical protein [Bremerella cremea]|uniref:hypothetical protein n=1 Tax=Bremerella cremea TaxID=1031537 RepID=UPI0031ED06C7